jgi:hypothetical protein
MVPSTMPAVVVLISDLLNVEPLQVDRPDGRRRSSAVNLQVSLAAAEAASTFGTRNSVRFGHEA